MTLEDFTREDKKYGTYFNARDTICGNNTRVSVRFTTSFTEKHGNDLNALFNENFDAINERVQYIKDNYNVIADFAANGNVGLTEEWYGKKITEQEFKDAMVLVDVSISFGKRGISVTLDYRFKPDFFGGHSLLIAINEDNSLEDDGLAG